MATTVFVRRRLPIVFAACFLLAVLVALYLARSRRYDWKENYIVQLAGKYRLFVESEATPQSEDSRKNRGFIIDTPGCKIPKFDPFDASIVGLYEAKTEGYQCPGPPMFIFSQPDGSITIDESVLQQHYHLNASQITCAYQAIRRKYEKEGNVRENDHDLLKHRPLKFGEPLREDYVIVDCLMGKENFTHYFPLIRLKKSIERKKVQIPPPMPHLNVIAVGIDSISKLNFLRHFNKTRNFIKEKGSFFEMKGYTKVGDNTFPNLAPLLTGRFPQDIWNETVKDTMFFDDVDIIWRRYSQKGYRTFYAEDSPEYGTFNYGRRGFNETPTDYYLRPLYLAMHHSELRDKGPWFCFNSVVETDIIYNYLRDFVKGMGPRPYFAFAMVSAMTHDYLNYAGYEDYTTIRLLEDLWESGALNNSLLVIFGDHGLRFGAIRSTHIGKYEERMPFLYLRFPPWFLERFPHIEKNLRGNQERLVTLFDVHATMVHLLDANRELTPEERTEATPYGASLMTEISPYRTCEDAFVYPFWCCCHVLHPLPAHHKTVVESAAAALEHVNARLKDTTCSALELEEVKSARRGRLNDLVLRFVRHENVAIDRDVVYGDRIVKFEDLWVTFRTRPGGLTFEGTVRRDVEDLSYQVVDVFRIDSHSPDSGCTADPDLVPLCHCDS